MGNNVLVVDDDPVEVTLVQARLRKMGYEVSTAVNGRLGLESVAKNRPDLIVLDIEMPEMNGYSFIIELRKVPEWQSIPVIVLTAHEENRPIFARRGIQHYLVKPVNFDELLPKISLLLNGN